MRNKTFAGLSPAGLQPHVWAGRVRNEPALRSLDHLLAPRPGHRKPLVPDGLDSNFDLLG